MYYIQQNNAIAMCDADLNILNNTIAHIPELAGAEILETDRNIILLNGAFVFEDEHLGEILASAKAAKQQENTEKAKQAVENGHVVFKNAEFETNAQTVGDLTATMLLMQAGGIETYMWLSKDDQAVALTVEDFGTLGGLIAEYKNSVWQEKYINYKTQIEQAQTVDAVNAIVLDYSSEGAE